MTELTLATGEENIQIETTVLDVDPQQVYARGKVDINFFGMFMLPTVCTEPFPDFYVAIFHILSMRKKEDIGRILRFALGLPRGHAKTTFLKVIIAWLIVYDRITFAIIVCATDDLAENLLSDVSTMLGSHNAEAVYGRWTENLSTDNKSHKEGSYHLRPVVLIAKGAGSSLRGINIANSRPDFILCDDAQTKECDESETERKKFKAWITNTLFPIIAPRGDRCIVYVGNLYSDECFLALLRKNKKWISFVTGAILESGEPLWPALHSLESLKDSYENALELDEVDGWFAEMMNDPMSRSNSLIDGPIHCDPLESYPEPDGVFVTIDPAGFRDGADDNVIALHFVIDGKPRVVKTETDIKDPEQLVLKALSMCIESGGTLIGVEDVAFQQTLLFWFNKYITANNLQGINVVPLKPAGRTKESRIRVFIKELQVGNYYLERTIFSAFMWQAMKYKVGKKKNKDDLMDACAYGIDIRNNYWHLVGNTRMQQLLKNIKAGVRMNNTPF